MARRLIVWGLRSSRHSHAHIHRRFKDASEQLGWETVWPDDEVEAAPLIKSGDTVIGWGEAMRHLPIVSGAKYVLHNVAQNRAETFAEAKLLNLGVFVADAPGEKILPGVVYDVESHTLSQPWGVPLLERGDPLFPTGNREVFSGSVWDNELGQGNTRAIRSLKLALKQKKIRFKVLGGYSSRLQKYLPKPSDDDLGRFLRQSRYGLSPVGAWQKENLYLPCRLFMNTQFGALPASNGDYSFIFPSGVFDSDFSSLISKLESLSSLDRASRTHEAQAALTSYSYQAGLQRIIEILYG